MAEAIKWTAMDATMMVQTELAHVYAEVLQVLNQRFQLLTLSVLGTTGVIGWEVSQLVGASGSRAESAWAITACGLILIGLLHLVSTMLLRTLRIFTSLIKVRYEAEPGSPLWHEHIWQEFRRTPYSAYSKPFAIVYGILGGVLWAFPWLLRVVQRGQPLVWSNGDTIAASLLVLFILTILASTRYREASTSLTEIERSWLAAVRAASKPSDPSLKPTRSSTR